MKKLIIGIFLAFILLISGIFSSNTYAGCGCDSGGGVCLCSLPVGICESCGGDGDDCPYTNLRGALDVANCTEIKGWVHDVYSS